MSVQSPRVCNPQFQKMNGEIGGGDLGHLAPDDLRAVAARRGMILLSIDEEVPARRRNDRQHEHDDDDRKKRLRIFLCRFARSAFGP